MPLHGVLDEAAAAFPDRPFVIGSGMSCSYRDVVQRSIELAGGLAERGIGKGDRVALILANYPDYVPLKYAISRLGAIAVPINILLKSAELRYILAQSGSVALITMDAFRGVDHLAVLDEAAPGWDSGEGSAVLPGLRHIIVFHTPEGDVRPRVQLLDKLDVASDDRILPEIDPSSVCDILYTSGTTGPPKGVMLTHDMLTRTAFGSAFARGFGDGHRIAFALPMFHVFGYVEGLLSVPFVHGAIVPQTRFDPAAMLDAIESWRVDDALLIPAMSLALVEEAARHPRDLSSLKHALASGGKAPPRLWSQLRSRLGIEEITTGYGMTETTASTTVTDPGDPEERLLTTNGRLRPVGPAADPDLDGILVDYRVVDPESGRTLAADEMGELQARGIGVTAGYYGKPDETQAAFTTDGWLRTGDLGTIDRDGYIALLGRTKESYRCGGEQVLPSEVEDVIAQLDGVAQCFVAPLPDERMGEVGVAFVIPQEGAEIMEEAIIEEAAARLARFKVPRHVLLVKEADLPLTASGRAKKFELTKMAIARLGGS